MLESDYNGYKVRLVENGDDLRYLAHVIGNNPKIMVGVDSETESLEYKPECVAGWCLAAGKSYSKQDYAGYYLPIRHYDYDNNLPINKVNELVSLCLWKRKTCFWNRNFDVSMAEMDGIKIPFIGHMNDGQVMAHLAFSESYPALKPTVEKLLKFDVLEFSSNNAKDHNFKTTNPRVSYKYACFSYDTKFMTKSGWKTYDEIKEGEEIAQWNPDTDELEFVVPISRHEYLDADTLEFRNGAISCCVTPNHRVYGRNNRRRSWQVRYAEDWNGKSFQVKTQTKGWKGIEHKNFRFEASKSCGGKLNTSIVKFDNALDLTALPFFKLLGFLLGDGNVCKNNSSWSVRFVQSSGEERLEHVKWLDNLNRELGGIFKKVLEPLRSGKKHRMWVWSCNHKNLGGWLRENLYNEDNLKKVPSCVFNASIEQRKAFLEGLRVADGAERKGGNNYHIDVCSNKKLAEQVLYLVNSVGLTAKMSCNLNKAGTTTFGKEDYICYRILINPQLEARSIDKKSWSTSGKKRVVCFTVPSSFLLVQRDYTTYVSGNSQDPLVTTLVTMKLWNDYPYIRKIYPLDNMTLEAVRLMSQQEVNLDFPLLKRMLAVEQKKLAEIKAQIYAIAGYQFNLNSNADRGDALCFSEDTQFLTRDGFKKYRDIGNGEEIAQWNVDKQIAEFVLPEGRIERDANEMIEINHPHARYCVTFGHNMYANKNVPKNDKDYDLIKIDDLINRKRGFRVKNTFSIEGTERVQNFEFEHSWKSQRLSLNADAFIEFLGFWLGDGSCTVTEGLKKDGKKHRNYHVTLTQSDCEKKASTVEWINSLNLRLGNIFKRSHRENLHRYDWKKSHKGLSLWINSNFERTGVKRIPKWIYTLSVRQRRIFLEAFIRADGYKESETRSSLYAYNKDLIEDLHLLAAISGYKVTAIRANSIPGSIKKIKGVDLKSISKGTFMFSVCKYTNYSHIKPRSISIRKGKTRVCCFQVPSSVLVVKYKGTVSLCGNCRFVTLTKKGKSGKFLVDKETLAQIDHPLAKLLVEYNEQRVYLSSFLEKMCNYDDGKPVRFSTDSTNVVTGRLSSGGKKGNSYYRPQNIQNVPKVQVEGRVFLDSDIGVAIKDHPDNLWSPDSQIKLKDSVKSLSEVKEGDKINDDVDVDYVSKVQSDGVELELDNGKTIKLGNNQFIPITRDGEQTFVMVKDLRESDEILLNE